MSQKIAVSFPSSCPHFTSHFTSWLERKPFSCSYLLAHLQGQAGGLALPFWADVQWCSFFSLGLHCWLNLAAPVLRAGTEPMATEPPFILHKWIFSSFSSSPSSSSPPVSSSHLSIPYQKLICLLIFKDLHSANDQWASRLHLTFHVRPLSLLSPLFILREIVDGKFSWRFGVFHNIVVPQGFYSWLTLKY